MKAWIAGATGMTLLGLAGQASAQNQVFLTCSIARQGFNARMEPTGIVREDRIFRLAPDNFQEWKADEKRFGANLCRNFKCVRSAEKLEGTVQSSSVSYTIGIDRNTRAGYWRSQGATGFSESSGACRETTDPAQKPR